MRYLALSLLLATTGCFAIPSWVSFRYWQGEADLDSPAGRVVESYAVGAEVGYNLDARRGITGDTFSQDVRRAQDEEVARRVREYSKPLQTAPAALTPPPIEDALFALWSESGLPEAGGGGLLAVLAGLLGRRWWVRRKGEA